MMNKMVSLVGKNSSLLHSMKMLYAPSVRNGYYHAKDFHAPEEELHHHEEPVYFRIDVGPGRKQIGYGYSSEKVYFDYFDIPMPSCHWKRDDDPGVITLREKEKGDWKKLSIQDKKDLYRASFCQTYAEFETSDGEWKSIFGWVFIWLSVGMWWFMGIYWLVNRGELRPSLTLESRQAQLQRLIAMKANPIFGIASKWDYEKEDWKKE